MFRFRWPTIWFIVYTPPRAFISLALSFDRDLKLMYLQSVWDAVERAAPSHLFALCSLVFSSQIPRPIVGGETVTYRTCTPPGVQLPPTPTSNYVALDEVDAPCVCVRVCVCVCFPLVGMLLEQF